MALTKCGVQSTLSTCPATPHLDHYKFLIKQENIDRDERECSTYVKNEQLTRKDWEKLKGIKKFNDLLDAGLDIRIEKTVDPNMYPPAVNSDIPTSKSQSSIVVDANNHKYPSNQNPLKRKCQNNLRLLKRCKNFRIRLKNLHLKTVDSTNLPQSTIHDFDNSHKVPETNPKINSICSKISELQKVPVNNKTPFYKFTETETYLKCLKLELEKSNLKLRALDFKKKVDEQVFSLLN